MSRILLPDSRIVQPVYSRMRSDEAFSGMISFLRSEGHHQKSDRLITICKNAVVGSFEADPVRNLTQNMMQERARMVGEIIVECVFERRWSIQRIAAEVLNMTLEKLDAKKSLKRERSSWGVVTDNEVELEDEDPRDS